MTAARQIDPMLLDECRRLGAQYNVCGDVHDDDFIFWFIHNHYLFPIKVDAVANYFAAGRESAQKVGILLRKYCPIERPETLEFASGYGCVTRHLKNEFAEASVTACDIHDQALAFLAAYMHVATMCSSNVPEQLSAERKFDAVFAISFFTHMPKTTWQRWLKALADRVVPGGAMLFTTHGRKSLRYADNPTLDPDGFWFVPSSEQMA
jgi:2-polyprenyl-3-methyl-5-hydroxy-6-metoxy-1,4-benzoquinol methylase